MGDKPSFFQTVTEIYRGKALASTKNMLQHLREDCTVEKHMFWKSLKKNYSSPAAYHDAKAVQTLLLEQKGPAFIMVGLVNCALIAFVRRMRRPVVAVCSLACSLALTNFFI